MKTTRFAQLAATAFGVAVFSAAGCTAKETPATAALPPASDAATAPPAAAAANSPDDATAKWSEIKDSTYDTRAAFFAGLQRLEARVDEQVRELKAKRVVMSKNATDITDWDFAMKDLIAAQSYLTSMGTELGKASRETWDQHKAKVAEAWVWTQNAYAKVKASTTS